MSETTNEDELGSLLRIIFQLQERLRRTNGTMVKYGKSHKKIMDMNYKAIANSVTELEKLLARRKQDQQPLVEQGAHALQKYWWKKDYEGQYTQTAYDVSGVVINAIANQLINKE